MSETLDFDPNALREKYRHERDRRLRPDGNDQYVEVGVVLKQPRPFDVGALKRRMHLSGTERPG